MPELDLDAPRLAAVVRAAVASSGIEVLDAHRAEVEYDPFMPGRTLSRLFGTARTPIGIRAWAVIEKATGGPDRAPAFIRDGARRELGAYRSGLLEGLPEGFAAPRVYGLHEEADGGVVIHMEEVVDEHPGPWGADEWHLAARHLGSFTARGLREPWSHEPWMLERWSERHGQPHAIEAARELIAEHAGHAVVVAHLGRDVASFGSAILAGQSELRAALDRLPQTLCHHDALRANLFMRSTDRGVETVAIDWETAGPGPVGADLASLVFSSARRGDLAAADIPGLIPSVMDAYGAEVVAGGAHEPASLVAAGFWGSMALRWSLLRDVVAALVTPGGSVARGRAMHEAPDVAMAEFVALMDVLRVAWGHVESGVLTEGSAW